MSDWLLPRRCVVCARPGAGLCGACAGRLAPPRPGTNPPGIDVVVALCAYDGVGRDLVLALKRRNRRDAVGQVGRALATALAAGLSGRGFECDLTPIITWAPTTPRRRRDRGFDQAELLARAIASVGGWPVQRLLCRDAPAQMGLQLDERLTGPRFEVHPGTLRRGVPTEVVVVDDVITSGATLTAAATALRAAGTRHVQAAVIARAERTLY